MNGLPYYKRYPKDFLDATIGWSLELKGAYSTLLDLIYMNGGKLPDDPRYISGHLGCSVRAWNGHKKDLMDRGKIACADGIISNFRATFEVDKLKIISDKQSENARKPRKNNGLTVAAAKPKPSHTDTDTERKKEVGASAPFDHLIRVVSEDVARAFIDHRKNKKAPLTAQAAKLIADKLAGRRDADDLVNTSIMNGWTGVFPDKPETRQKQDAGDFWTGPRLG